MDKPVSETLLQEGAECKKFTNNKKQIIYRQIEEDVCKHGQCAPVSSRVSLFSLKPRNTMDASPQQPFHARHPCPVLHCCCPASSLGSCEGQLFCKLQGLLSECHCDYRAYKIKQVLPEMFI